MAADICHKSGDKPAWGTWVLDYKKAGTGDSSPEFCLYMPPSADRLAEFSHQKFLEQFQVAGTL